MKIIYIRHGKKLYANNKVDNKRTPWLRKHDPPLSRDGVKQIKDLAEEIKLEMEEGRMVKPEIVLVSPYIRTQDTWGILKRELFDSEIDRELNILSKIDPYVSEFLGNQKYTDRTLFTEKYNPPNHTETILMLEERVRRHVEEMEVMKANGVETVWVVSHGFTIYKILECILRIQQPEFYLDEGDIMQVCI